MPETTPCRDDNADPQLRALRRRARDLHGLLRVALALLHEGRAVELSGLEEQVGRLCAAALDLAPEPGRGLRDELIALLAEVEALAMVLRERPPA
jgi:hypothetical protein